MSVKIPIKIKLEKNALPGYTLIANQKTRRSILSNISTKQGWGTVVKKLNVLRIFNKNKYPDKSAKYYKDMRFIQKLHLTEKHSIKRRSIKKSIKRRSIKKSIKKRSIKKSIKRRSIKKRR